MCSSAQCRALVTAPCTQQVGQPWPAPACLMQMSERCSTEIRKALLGYGNANVSLFNFQIIDPNGSSELFIFLALFIFISREGRTSEGH